jgi:hypothetical protein
MAPMRLTTRAERMAALAAGSKRAVALSGLLANLGQGLR